MNALERIAAGSTVTLALMGGTAAADVINTEPGEATPEAITEALNEARLHAMQSSCTFYTNLLNNIDRVHFSGPTDVSHKVMAEAAMRSMLRGSTVTFQDAPEGMDSYDDHCAYLGAGIEDLAAAGEDIDVFKLYEGAVNAVLAETRDPHTSYLSFEARESMMESTRGSFGGVGLMVNKQDESGFIEAVKPIRGAPAIQAGVEAGDLITHIDGESIVDMSLSDVVGMMKGDPGEEITLTIKRGDAEPFDVTFERAIVRVPAVEAELVGDIAYIKITDFSENLVPDIIKEMHLLMTEAAMKGQAFEKVILDFKDNPGGLLDQALGTLDMFIKADPDERRRIMATGGLDEESRETVYDGDMTRFNFPGDIKLSVLINGGSASASEVIAGALQDEEGVTLVGNRSFGKGSVQSVFGMDSEGNFVQRRSDAIGGLKATMSLFFPGQLGVTNQGDGIHPDIQVIYNDFRDEREANRRHESSLGRTLVPEGVTTRSSLASSFTCTLNPDIAGPVSDEKVRQLSEELNHYFAMAQGVTEEQWNAIPEARKQQLIDGQVEYIQKFLEPVFVDGGFQNVLNAEFACAVQDQDGEQQLTINGEPITKIEPIGSETAPAPRPQ